MDDKRLLEVKDLKVHFFTDDGVVKAVDGVSFHIDKGETLAVVGESGSGKSVSSLAAMRLIPNPPGKIVSGEILFRGKDGQTRDLTKQDEATMRKIRGNDIAMIFQEPMTSLNPVYTVGDQISEAIVLHQGKSKKDALDMAAEMLDLVGIPEPRKRLTNYPHQMSGGMRQRVMIAMAIANNPVLLIADEPTTALDVTIQAQVLELLAELKSARNLAMIFISHSLPVVANVADRVAVMYAGEVMEEGPAAEIFAHPRHPYTAALIACSPSESDSAPKPIEGIVPSPAHLPPGCLFAERCAHRMEKCDHIRPTLDVIQPGRKTRCIRWSEL